MSYSSEVLADSPWLYWRLDDTSGTTAVDLSGNARTGTYSGSPTLAQTGLITDGTSASFDATDDYCRSASAIFNSSTATVEVWFNYSGTPPSSGQLGFIAGCNEGEASGTGDKHLVINSSGQVRWYVYTGGAGGTVDSLSAISAGIHHIVGVIDDPGNTQYLYIDGVLDNSAAASSSFAGYSNPNVMVGGFPTALSGEERLAGRRDEFALYTTALLPARILAHYQAGITEAVVTQVLVARHGTGMGHW